MTLRGVGGLVAFSLNQGFWEKFASRVLAFIALAGCLRLIQRNGLNHYWAYAGGHVALALLWYYPPNERFLFPLLVPVIAGCLVEFQNLGSMIRSAVRLRDPGSRVVCVLMAAAAAGLITCSVWQNARGAFGFIPDSLRWDRQLLARARAAYEEIARRLPADAVVIAASDPLVFLYAGRPAVSLPLPVLGVFAAKPEETLEPFRNIAEYARSRGADYVLTTEADLDFVLSNEESAEYHRIMLSQRALKLLFAGQGTALYEIAR